MTREDVFRAIDAERKYQDQKWGKRSKPTESYLVYMKSYLDEAIDAISRNPSDRQALDALRKVVALGVACFEDNGVPQRQ